MPEESCSNGPEDSQELIHQVTLFESGSGWVDYCLEQAAICYGHGIFHASVIFASEALETRLGELNPNITSFEKLIELASLGSYDKEVAHLIRSLRHYHVHPWQRLTKKTREGVREVIQKWGVDILTPDYLVEILGSELGEIVPDKIRTAFNRQELARKCIQETIRLLDQLKPSQSQSQPT